MKLIFNFGTVTIFTSVTVSERPGLWDEMIKRNIHNPEFNGYAYADPAYMVPRRGPKELGGGIFSGSEDSVYIEDIKAYIPTVLFKTKKL